MADPPAPGAAPTAPFAGRRNSPEWVRITAEWIAEQRGQTPDTIGAALVAAYDATFRRPQVAPERTPTEIRT